MSTELTQFVEPIRILIGDCDPDIQFREDSQILAAIKAVVNLGKVTGHAHLIDGVSWRYYMNAGGTGIDPTFTVQTDSKAWAQVVYHAAKLFAIDITPTHWRTRAFSETVGENRERVFNLLTEIYHLENGAFSGSSCHTSTYDPDVLDAFRHLH